MFCGKCGKETGAGGFCPHCGAAVKKSEGNVTPVPVTTREKERKAGKKGKHIGHYLILMLLIVGAGGLYLYFIGDSYRCRKFLKQAEAYLEEGKYQEALKYCESAIDLDDQCVEAYQKSADIYVAMDAYGDAIEILKDGQKVLDDKEEFLEKKLEEVYQKEAKCLEGVWTLDYNLGDLIPEGYGDLLGVDIQVPILMEIGGDGIIWFSVEKEYFAGAQSTLSSAAQMLCTVYTKIPFLGNLAGKVTDFLTGLLIDNVGVSYSYQAKNGVLYCTWSGDDAAEEMYEFVIDGDNLIFLGELTEGEDSYYLQFPLTLQRVK